MKRVLLIAFQYPPMTGTSGIQRALRFSQYLPEFGWEPIVLTAHPRAYAQTSADQLEDIPGEITVERAFALDTARHLALFGRYPSVLALPDRWATWWLGAVPRGLDLIKRLRPSAIWSTFPIPTAHRIGLSLQRHSGLPWVADFRDVMTEDEYPASPRIWRSWRKLEGLIVQRCARAVFTTPGAARMYAERYATRPARHFCVIENGYDEQLFARIAHEEATTASVNGSAQRRLRVVHSGVIYPSERDPTQLFAALRELRDVGRLHANELVIVLRATGHDEHLRKLVRAADIEDMIDIAPPIAYRDALAEMVSADGLLLLQAANCDRQIPAKLYEYLRSGRPVLGLATGDTAQALRSAGIDTVAPLASKEAIKQVITTFVEALRQGIAPVSSGESIRRHSRRHKAGELAEILDHVSE